MADKKKPSMSQLRDKLKKTTAAKPTTAQLQAKYKREGKAAVKKAATTTTITKPTTEATDTPVVEAVEKSTSSKATYKPPRINKKKDIQHLPTFTKDQQAELKEGTVVDEASSLTLRRGEYRDQLARYFSVMNVKQLISMAKKYKVDGKKITQYQKLSNPGLTRMNLGGQIRKAINTQLAA